MQEEYPIVEFDYPETEPLTEEQLLLKRQQYKERKRMNQMNYYNNHKEKCQIDKLLHYYSKWFDKQYLYKLVEDLGKHKALNILKIERLKAKQDELRSKVLPDRKPIPTFTFNYF
jgi:hypothetical protein